MALNIQEEILDKLERIKNSKKRSQYMSPDDYKQFMPETMGFQKDDESLRYKVLDQIKEKGIDASYLNAIQGANKRARMAAIDQRRRLNQEKRRFQQTKRAYRPPTFNAPSYEPAPTPGGFKAGVGQYLATVRAGGKTFTVNKHVAPRFVGFVNALAKQGYRPVSIGGYNNRNIAGTNQKSLHAYGLAIDIDPAKNPMYYNSPGHRPHGLPRNVGSLAAKYGLSWGGNWKNSKDYMHFSVPYGGRQ